MLMDTKTNTVATLQEWVKSKSSLDYDKIDYLPEISSIEDLVEVRWNSYTQSWEEIKFFLDK